MNRRRSDLGLLLIAATMVVGSLIWAWHERRVENRRPPVEHINTAH